MWIPQNVSLEVLRIAHHNLYCYHVKAKRQRWILAVVNGCENELRLK